MKMLEFVRRERLYFLLLIFIMLVNVAASLPGDVRRRSGKTPGSLNVMTLDGEKAGEIEEDLAARRAELEKKLAGDRRFALIYSLAALIILAMLISGILINVRILTAGRGGMDLRTYGMGAVKWSVLDVAKVATLFTFFGYMMVMAEAFLLRQFPLLKDDNFRMIFNSSILDVISVVLIFYFTVRRYGEKLVSLGLSLKNFFRNILYGIVGYIAAVPILLGTLLVIVLIINLTGYVPEKQPVVELFLKEKDATFLIYSSIFASAVGPLIEELFFRGFMYNACKRYIGILPAALVTSTVFASLHANVVAFVPITVLGMTLAYIYEKTGTLVASITVHMTHNMCMLGLVFLIKELRA